tara:strand:- start:27218 stop:28645 length:1428 start_codon:yes stop_codon:yes gene_type:complete
MSSRPTEFAVVVAGLLYLGVLSWSMGNISYDIWGAIVLVPIYAMIGILLMFRMFRGSERVVATVMCWGLLLKLAGALARYWVGFEAYGGGIDAAQYHKFAAKEAGRVWSGEQGVLDVVPSGTGTEFVDHFTAFIYTFTGSSQLAGFISFAFLAYIGLAFFVKAAVIAIPALAVRKYALLCVICPSLAYWPSSIGKEALMMLGLGIGTYGIADMLTRGRWATSLPLIATGLGFVAIIRPHLAGIWVAAVLPSILIALFNRVRSTHGGRQVSKLGLVITLTIAVAALAFVASATITFLAPNTEDGTSTADSISQILEETARRTSQAGSNFTPPSVSSPVSWPYASIRTITRPLLIEAQGIAQLASAAEILALLGVYLLSWRRIRNLPRFFASNPYVGFVVMAAFLAGLAYSSLANLGILTRQKSLIFPLLLLFPCLPLQTGSTQKKPSSEAPAKDIELMSSVRGRSRATEEIRSESV